MPKMPAALSMMPPAAAAALKRVGESLAIARVRRNEPQRVWAQRLGVSIPTLIRMEQGDARVAMGIYATAFWMMGRIEAFAEIADPKNDRGALELDVRRAVKKRAVRSPTSTEARLARKSV